MDRKTQHGRSWISRLAARLQFDVPGGQHNVIYWQAVNRFQFLFEKRPCHLCDKSIFHSRIGGTLIVRHMSGERARETGR